MRRSRPRFLERFPEEVLALVLTLALAACGGLAHSPALAQDVVLPIAEYDRLRQAVRGDDGEPALDFAFLSAEVELTVDGDVARTRQKLTIHVFGPERVRIPIPRAGSWLDFEATKPADSAEALLLGELGPDSESGGQLELHGAGRYVLVLRSVQALAKDDAARAGERRLRLALPDAAAVDVLIDAPGLSEITSDVATVLVGPGPPEGRWRLLPGDRRDALDLTLHAAPAGDDALDRPLRFTARTSTETRVGRLRTDATAKVAVDLWQGRLKTLDLELPDGLDVVRVDGEAVADWRVEERRLRLETSVPTSSTLTAEIALTGGGLASGGALSTPVLRVPGTQDESLSARVTLEGDGILSLDDPGSGRELRDGAASSGGLWLEIADADRPPLWSVRWADDTDVLALQVDRMLLDVVVGGPTEDGGAARAFYRVWTEVRSSGAGRLALDLPGARLVRVERGGSRFQTGLSPTGWMVPLAANAGAQLVRFDLVADVHWPDGDGVLVLNLPSLGAPVAKVEARVHLPGAGRSYHLADPAHAGVAGRPPRIDLAEDDGGEFGRQLRQNQAVRVRSTRDDSLLGAPTGFHALEASWSALSPSPGPLRIQVDAQRLDKEWL